MLLLNKYLILEENLFLILIYLYFNLSNNKYAMSKKNRTKRRNRERKMNKKIHF